MSKAKRKATLYAVTLRRDVQQLARVDIEAFSQQEAVDVAESIVDENAWRLEEYIGTHKPEVVKSVEDALRRSNTKAKLQRSNSKARLQRSNSKAKLQRSNTKARTKRAR